MRDDPYFKIPYTLTDSVVDDVRDAICTSLQEMADDDPRLNVDFHARCDYGVRVSGDIETRKMAEAAVAACFKTIGTCLAEIKPDKRF